MTEMGFQTGGCAVTSWWQGDAWLLLLPPLCQPCEEWEGLSGFFLWPWAGHSLPALLVYENNGDGSHILGLFGHFIRPYLYKGDQNCGLPAVYHH